MTLYGEGSNASSTNQGEPSITELWGAENSFLRNEREIRRSEGSGMLINNPLGKGSNAGSTNSELYQQRALESGELIPQMRGNLDAQKGAACS